jgi:hypothetical protein
MGDTDVVRRTVLAALLAVSGAAQELRIYSEFRRIDPFGKIVPADRGGKVREILSPAAARNAYTSFRIAVTLPPNTPSWLYLQQNPEDSFRITLYRELYVRGGATWIPDGLQRIKAPCFVLLPEEGSPIKGQTTQTYWLDLWAAPDIPVARVRVQAVLKAGERWLQYPLEVRVRPEIVPPGTSRRLVAARASAPADATAWAVLCGKTGQNARSGTVRELIARNALQDWKIAKQEGSLEDVCKAPATDREALLAYRRQLYK